MRGKKLRHENPGLKKSPFDNERRYEQLFGVAIVIHEGENETMFSKFVASPRLHGSEGQGVLDKTIRVT